MRCFLALCCVAALAVPATAQTLLFDFGNNARTTADTGWNNVIYDSGSPPPNIDPVVDSTGANVPGVTLEVTDQFFIAGQPSQGGSEAPSGDAAGYPVDATDDYFFGHTGEFAGNDSTPTGGFKLTGLSAGVPHNFTFFSSRTGIGDNRETAFEVTGSSSDSGVVATSNNDSEVLNINGILPDGNGEIAVLVSAGPNNDNGNQFYYINLMEVNVVPEPATGLLLASSVLLLAGRRRR